MRGIVTLPDTVGRFSVGLLSVSSVPLWFVVHRCRTSTSYPMVMSISPVAVQAGADDGVRGRRPATTSRRLPGLRHRRRRDRDGRSAQGAEATGHEAASADRLKVRFQAAADALPGVRDVRVATPQGASTLGQIVVVRDPIVREAANNDTLQTAQPITLPAAVCGAIEKPEDVDYYKFGRGGHGPDLSRLRASGCRTRSTTCRNTPTRSSRCATPPAPCWPPTTTTSPPTRCCTTASPRPASTTSKSATRRYGGNADWHYCIEINDRPFVTNVYPSRVTPGQPTRAATGRPQPAGRSDGHAHPAGRHARRAALGRAAAGKQTTNPCR